MRREEVVWFNPKYSTDSMSIEYMKKHFKPEVSSSIGYLVKETADYIILVFVKIDDDMFKYWHMIPKGIIKSRKELE